MTDCTSFQETSFSLYQQLVAPGGLRLRGGERETGRKVHMINLSKNLNVKVYNSYPKCFDSSINSKKKHVQHNCWSKLGNLTFHKTIFLFNQYLTFHIRSELGHFTCWGKIGAFFWDITITFWPKKYLTLNQSDAMKIWCVCTLARVVGEDKNSIQIPNDAIDICFKFRNTNYSVNRFLIILGLDTFTHILNTNLPDNRGRKDIFWNQV